MKKEKLFEIIATSKSKNEMLLKYFGYANKSAYDKLNEFIIENNIELSHLNKKINTCLNCGEIIPNRNKFCNSSCAATYNNKNRILNDETKNKIRNSINKKYVNIKHIKEKILQEKKLRNCVVCDIEFNPLKTLSGNISRAKCCSDNCRLILIRKFKPNGIVIESCRHCGDKLTKLQKESKNMFCSNKCSTTYRYLSQEERNKSSIIMKNLAKDGLLKGWATRNIISYPEQFFMNVLNNNNINYIHNHPVNKRDLGLNDSCNYFLDFYFKDKNIDLEIDGSQHKYRGEHDEKRDEVLKKNGYIVYRIIWKSIKSVEGKEYIENEIEKFLEFYENS